MQIRKLYQTIRIKLQNAGIENAKQEAGWILEFLYQEEYTALPQILLHGEQEVSNAICQKAETLCEKREQHYPLQYLFGNWDFYGLELQIGEGVLIPRADTETLVDLVLELLNISPERGDVSEADRGVSSIKLLDLCSGSGCIPAAIGTQMSSITGTAIEFSPQAFSYLKENLCRYAPAIQPVLGDVRDATLAVQYSNMDILTCNPPYLTAAEMQELQTEVTFEPEMALYGGTDGLAFYRTITARWKSALKPGGWMVYEIGKGQEDDVIKILKENGFSEIQQKQDACGIVRVVAGRNLCNRTHRVMDLYL